ncbi:preprotein translocase subunit SecG [Singulisphaera rosea]
MGILSGILSSLLVLTSLFLICLVLIQRGKGGGLAGAFGGVGGSSAFGTKAGDVFTKVTMCVAGFWYFLCMILVIIANRGADSAWDNSTSPATTKVSKDITGTVGGKASKDASSTMPPPVVPAPSTTPAPAAKIPSSSPAAPTDVPAIPPAK